MAQNISGKESNIEEPDNLSSKEITITKDDLKTYLDVRALLANEDGNITIQNPLPSDGDSVYVKDIDIDNSDNGDFTGLVTNYFDSLKTVNTNITGTNPKIITIRFKRSLQTSAIGLGCDDPTKNFSNVVIK